MAAMASSPDITGAATAIKSGASFNAEGVALD